MNWLNKIDDVLENAFTPEHGSPKRKHASASVSVSSIESTNDAEETVRNDADEEEEEEIVVDLFFQKTFPPSETIHHHSSLLPPQRASGTPGRLKRRPRNNRTSHNDTNKQPTADAVATTTATTAATTASTTTTNTTTTLEDAVPRSATTPTKTTETLTVPLQPLKGRPSPPGRLEHRSLVTSSFAASSSSSSFSIESTNGTNANNDAGTNHQRIESMQQVDEKTDSARQTTKRSVISTTSAANAATTRPNQAEEEEDDDDPAERSIMITEGSKQHEHQLPSKRLDDKPSYMKEQSKGGKDKEDVSSEDSKDAVTPMKNVVESTGVVPFNKPPRQAPEFNHAATPTIQNRTNNMTITAPLYPTALETPQKRPSRLTESPIPLDQNRMTVSKPSDSLLQTQPSPEPSPAPPQSQLVSIASPQRQLHVQNATSVPVFKPAATPGRLSVARHPVTTRQPNEKNEDSSDGSDQDGGDGGEDLDDSNRVVTNRRVITLAPVTQQQQLKQQLLLQQQQHQRLLPSQLPTTIPNTPRMTDDATCSTISTEAAATDSENPSKSKKYETTALPPLPTLSASAINSFEDQKEEEEDDDDGGRQPMLVVQDEKGELKVAHPGTKPTQSSATQGFAQAERAIIASAPRNSFPYTAVSPAKKRSLTERRESAPYTRSASLSSDVARGYNGYSQDDSVSGIQSLPKHVEFRSESDSDEVKEKALPGWNVSTDGEFDSRLNRYGVVHVRVLGAQRLQCSVGSAVHAIVSLHPWKGQIRTEAAKSFAGSSAKRNGVCVAWDEEATPAISMVHAYSSEESPVPSIEVKLAVSPLGSSLFEFLMCTLTVSCEPLLRAPNVPLRQWFTTSTKGRDAEKEPIIELEAMFDPAEDEATDVDYEDCDIEPSERLDDVFPSHEIAMSLMPMHSSKASVSSLKFDDSSVHSMHSSIKGRLAPTKPHLLRVATHWTPASCCVCKRSLLSGILSKSYHCEECGIDCCGDCRLHVDVQLPCGSDLALKARDAAVQNNLTVDKILNVVAPIPEDDSSQKGDKPKAFAQRMASLADSQVGEDIEENRIGVMKFEFDRAVIYASTFPAHSDVDELHKNKTLPVRAGDYYIRVSWTAGPDTKRTRTIQNTGRPKFESQEMRFNV